jgi:transposase
MIIIGCDFHPGWQQICWLDKDTGETAEQKLVHGSGEVQKFYQQLAAPALMGMEATGNCQWFVEMVKAAGHEVWIGDAAQIRASDVRQQKHDRRDAALLLQLLLEGRFPRIWTPSRPAAVADSPLQAGAIASASKERIAASGVEPGTAEEAAAVE